jgi:hypothetical protein
MQPRCVWCKKEQYAVAVYEVSHGLGGCAWCGRTAPVFTSYREYKEALARPAEPKYVAGDEPGGLAF